MSVVMLHTTWVQYEWKYTKTTNLAKHNPICNIANEIWYKCGFIPSNQISISYQADTILTWMYYIWMCSRFYTPTVMTFSTESLGGAKNGNCYQISLKLRAVMSQTKCILGTSNYSAGVRGADPGITGKLSNIEQMLNYVRSYFTGLRREFRI